MTVSLHRLRERFPALCVGAAARDVELAELARRLAGELRRLRTGTGTVKLYRPSRGNDKLVNSSPRRFTTRTNWSFVSGPPSKANPRSPTPRPGTGSSKEHPGPAQRPEGSIL